MLCEGVCRGSLQLPNFRGQEWKSMGKSSRCIGHSACTVNLGQREMETERGSEDGDDKRQREKERRKRTGIHRGKWDSSIHFRVIPTNSNTPHITVNCTHLTRLTKLARREAASDTHLPPSQENLGEIFLPQPPGMFPLKSVNWADGTKALSDTYRGSLLRIIAPVTSNGPPLVLH